MNPINSSVSVSAVDESSVSLASVDTSEVPHRSALTIRRVQRLLVAGDLVVITVALLAGNVARFGFTDPVVAGSTQSIPLTYIPFSVALGLVWWLLLNAMDAYREGILGTGTDEYQRLAEATFVVFGCVAIGAYLLKVDVSRGYFALVLPVGLAGLLVWRWMARKVLVAARRHGHLTRRTLVIGSSLTAGDMAREILRRPNLGMSLVGACVTDATSASTLSGTDVPVLRCLQADDVAVLRTVIEGAEAETVIITASPRLSSRKIRELSWSLDPEKTSMIVAPSVVDVAGPRLHARPVDGLSLIEVDFPQFQGGRRFLKRVFDIVVSVVAIVALTPVWLIVPLVIKADDRGPVFFRQTRVGKDGEKFQILKFRSMRVNADAELKRLLEEQGTDGKPLFKVREDPRITRIGAFLRKSSVDELPQLFNVLGGSMSLVGPRPQVPAEVALYDAQASRRLFVKPGITGLWQVNGRSALSWEESVRLDLSYAENWSMMLDIQILFRTVKVVLKRDGAY
ncbi:MAG: sugar transferase [Actinomyces sp.]|nr:sugar transferase [Actinomyces sp.]MCI1788331.1 sugar transferase [Actinomyces sp.]